MNSNTTILALTAIILALLAIIREDLRATKRGTIAPEPNWPTAPKAKTA